MSASVTGSFFWKSANSSRISSVWLGQVHLVLVVVGGVQAALLGLLHEDLAGDDFVLELALHLGRHGAAGLGNLLGQRVGTRLGHRLAVDDGQVLRRRRAGRMRRPGQPLQQRSGNGSS
jgi:ABC-type uncharacterized transport system permease subunit